MNDASDVSARVNLQELAIRRAWGACEIEGKRCYSLDLADGVGVCVFPETQPER